MSGMGVAMMGTGMAEGDNRAMTAAQKAIASPLLEDSSVNGARGVIINVTGGPDLSLIEVNEASCVIQEAAHEDANIIFGAVVDPELVGKVKITVIATGFDRKTSRVSATGASQTPVDMSRYQEYAQRVAAAAGAGPLPFESADAPQPISRRPTIEVPLRSVDAGSKAVRASASGNGEAPDQSSQFDVPAFLRRT